MNFTYRVINLEWLKSTSIYSNQELFALICYRMYYIRLTEIGTYTLVTLRSLYLPLNESYSTYLFAWFLFSPG